VIHIGFGLAFTVCESLHHLASQTPVKPEAEPQGLESLNLQWLRRVIHYLKLVFFWRGRGRPIVRSCRKNRKFASAAFSLFETVMMK
jgi:hypothetical protein